MFYEFWFPGNRWQDRDIFVIGGGPSLKNFKFEILRNKHVLAINEAYVDVPWAEVLFFRDCEWFDESRPDKKDFHGLIVTTSTRAKENYPQIKLVKINTLDMPRARTGGHNAVSLALWMKVKRIILLGFDWNPEGGNYHDRHNRPGLKYRGGLIASWGKYYERAKRDNVEILNATPGSQIREFEKINLRDVL